MTPDDVRQRIAAIEPLGHGDPERWHSERDQIHRDVLAGIRDGHPDPAGLAAAALATERHAPLWQSCS